MTRTESSEQWLSEHLAEVSHELRTPLNAIIGWLEVLRKKRDRQTVDRVLRVVDRSTTLQARLIEDLLDLSRCAKGQLRLDREPVALAPVVRGVIEMLRGSVDARSIVLRCSLDDTVPNVAGDVLRLHQVIWNLLANAVKFTPEYGTIDIQLARVGEAVEVTVQDSGAGIAPELLPVLFHPFHQGTKSPSGRAGGLGLGLAISRQIVEAHGGTITAKNVSGAAGAIFTVRLPVEYRGAQQPD